MASLLGNPNLTGTLVAFFLDNTVPGKDGFHTEIIDLACLLLKLLVMITLNKTLLTCLKKLLNSGKFLLRLNKGIYFNYCLYITAFNRGNYSLCYI